AIKRWEDRYLRPSAEALAPSAPVRHARRSSLSWRPWQLQGRVGRQLGYTGLQAADHAFTPTNVVVIGVAKLIVVI
ncbi:MAG: hypothetical protein ABSG43_21295, partial [Solirubrobacteraceae bacterium]